MRFSFARAAVTTHCHLAHCDCEWGKRNIADACHVGLLEHLSAELPRALDKKGWSWGDGGLIPRPGTRKGRRGDCWPYLTFKQCCPRSVQVQRP